jgi:hypothetical protein
MRLPVPGDRERGASITRTQAPPVGLCSEVERPDFLIRSDAETRTSDGGSAASMNMIVMVFSPGAAGRP